jgi:hypothetical protein
MGFSILTRRLLKRGEFASKEQLKQRIPAFIEFFNQTLAAASCRDWPAPAGLRGKPQRLGRGKDAAPTGGKIRPPRGADQQNSLAGRAIGPMKRVFIPENEDC